MPPITFNGQTYSDPNDMPPGVRQAYEQALRLLGDQNQNGVLDILEGLPTANSPAAAPPSVFSNTQFVVDGKVYARLEDLPPEARQKYQQAMAKMSQVLGDANQNGVPDMLEGAFTTGASTAGAFTPPAPPAPPPAPTPHQPIAPTIIGENNSRPGWLISGCLLGILLLFIVALVVAWPLLAQIMQ